MPETNNIRILIVLGVLALFGIITFALAAATLGTLNKRWNKLEERLAELTPATTTETPPPSLDSLLAETIQIEDLMRHLEEFEKIAKAEGNTRAIGTPGFTKTVDYIEQYLKENTKSMTTFREKFPVKNFSLNGNPTFSYSINNGIAQNLTYSTDLPQAEFTHVNYSAPIDLTSYELVLVKNNGCNDSDWGDVSGKAVLVIVGGPCTSSDKGQTARNKSAAAVIFYSNGLTISSLAPSIIRLRQKTDLPALFLSYAAGKKLADALNRNERVNISIEIKVHPYGTFEVENICADTNAGNRNETIVVGSHSDSVPAGPGINDNGSGSAANLVLAKNLDQLYSSGKYSPYRYRVRFCWWGAEEIGLVGSFAHIDNAKNASAAPGNSVKDYLVNLNYDMLGSPNYFFGIYDGNTAKPGTPVKALNGSRYLTDVYRRWFQSQKLFSSLTDFSGRSDYGPFLAEGIVAGGLFSGADDVKTVEERDGLKAGLAGATHDPCYHRDCDTVANIDRYGYLKMVQAAGYMLEYLGRQIDLHQLLYPSNS